KPLSNVTFSKVAAPKQYSFSHLSLATTPIQLIMSHPPTPAALLDSAITLLFLAFSLNQSPAQQLFIVSKKCFLIVFYFAFYLHCDRSSYIFYIRSSRLLARFSNIFYTYM